MRRVRRGTLAGWSIVPRAELETEVPYLFPFGAADHVLVRQLHASLGPFRDGDTSEPIALV